MAAACAQHQELGCCHHHNTSSPKAAHFCVGPLLHHRQELSMTLAWYRHALNQQGQMALQGIPITNINTKV